MLVYTLVVWEKEFSKLARLFMTKFFDKENLKILLFAFLLFIITTLYYSWMIYNHIGTDVQDHARYAYSVINADAKILPNFLYFFLVSILAGFSKYEIAYYMASIFLLAVAIALKFLINVYYIKKYTSLNRTLLLVSFSVFLLFVFCFPGIDFFKTKAFYLGQLAPNVWHNSTIIFLFPFSILLFFKSCELLDKYDKNILYQVTSLVVVNALIKPSFLFTLVPTFFILFFFKKRPFFSYWELRKIAPFVLAIVFIGVEYIIIYKLNSGSQAIRVDQRTDVIIAPFEVWGHYSTNIFFSFISSIFFPLICILFTQAEILRNKMVLFASINFLIGLFILIFFAEGGYRKLHGNFFWQIVIANYLLFFSCMLYLINDIRRNIILKPKHIILSAIFLLHFCWGVFYWLKIIILKGHY